MTDGLSWNASLLTGFVFVIVIAVITRILMFRPRKPLPSPKATPVKKTTSLVTVRNNGWISVSKESLAQQGEELADIVVPVPPIVRRMLYPLSNDERAWFSKAPESWCTHLQGQEKVDFLNDRRRGITIGSALFGYSFPRHLFLNDLRTRQLYHSFCLVNSVKMLPGEWLEHRKQDYEEHAKLFEEFERFHQLKEEDVFAFYLKHEKLLERFLLHTVNEFSIFPAIQGAQNGLLWQMREDSNNEITQHFFRIAITIAIRNLNVHVPSDWVAHSLLTINAYNRVRDYLDVAISGPQKELPKKNHLSLVTNNKE